MTGERLKAASTLAAGSLMTAVGAVCGAMTAPEHLAAAAGLAVAGSATSLFLNLFTASHADAKNAALSKRNHLLRRGMAEALRGALHVRRAAADLPPLPDDPYKALFESWFSLLERAIKDDRMLDDLFPVALADSHWQTIMRYDAGPAAGSNTNPASQQANDAIALGSLLRDYLTYDGKQHFLGLFSRNLTSRWNETEALDFAASVLPFYRQACDSDLTRGGPLSEAFELRALREQRDLLLQLTAKVESLLEPGLPLTTIKQLRAMEPIGPKEIRRFLDARYQAVPFVGRQEELENLYAWLAERTPISFRVLVGRGGLGKTRLAIRLLELLEERAQFGWHAGFIDSERCEPVLRGFVDIRRRRPTLIILDDASRWVEIMATFVLPALRNPIKDAPPLRFLLIDRGAQPGFLWYRKLLDAAEPAAKYIFAPIMKLGTLPGISKCSARIEFFDAALTALQNLTDQPKLVIDESAKRKLANEEMGDPLVLSMAALLAHERRDLIPLTYRRLDLADAIAGREKHRIEQLAQPEFLPLHMAAYITLVQGLSENDLQAACEEEKRAVEPDSTWGLVPLKNLLREKLLPGDHSDLAVAAIRPDIVGEVFVERTLDSPDHDANGTIYRAFLRRPEAVTNSLMKLASDLRAESTENSLENAVMVARRDRLYSTIDLLLAKLVDHVEKQSIEKPSAILPMINKVIELASQSTRLNPPWFCRQFAVVCSRFGELLGKNKDDVNATQAMLDISFRGLLQIKPLAIARADDTWNLAAALAWTYVAASLRQPRYPIPALTHSLTFAKDAADRANLHPDFAVTAPFVFLHRYVSEDKIEDISPIREMIEQSSTWHPESSEQLLAGIESTQTINGHLLTPLINETRERLREYKDQQPKALRRENVAHLVQKASLWNEADHPLEALRCLEECWPDLDTLLAEDPGFVPIQASIVALAADVQSKLFHRDRTIVDLTTAATLYRKIVKADARYAFPMSLVLSKLALLSFTDNKPRALDLLAEASSWGFEAALRDPLHLIWFWRDLRARERDLQFELGNHERAFQLDLEIERQTVALPFDQAKAERSTADSQGRVTVHSYYPPSLHSYYALEFERHDPDGAQWNSALQLRWQAEWMVLALGDTQQTPQIDLALHLMRELTENDRERFLPILVDWLNWYQQLLTYGGKLDKAITAIDEALSLLGESDAISIPDPQLIRQQLLLSREIIDIRNGVDPTRAIAAADVAERCFQLVSEGGNQFLPLLAQAKEIEAQILVASRRLDEGVSVLCDAVRAWEQFCCVRPSHVARLADCVSEVSKLQTANAQPMDALKSTSAAVLYYLRAPRMKYYYPHVLATLGDAVVRQFVLCGDDSNLATNTVDVVKQQVQQLREFVARKPEEFSEPLFFVQMSEVLCLVSRGDEVSLLAEIGEIADRGETLAVKKPQLSAALGLLYGVWAEKLVGPECVAKFRQAASHFANNLRQLAQLPASSVIKEQAYQLRGAYVAACEGAGIEPDSEILRPFG